MLVLRNRLVFLRMACLRRRIIEPDGLTREIRMVPVLRRRELVLGHAAMSTGRQNQIRVSLESSSVVWLKDWDRIQIKRREWRFPRLTILYT